MGSEWFERDSNYLLLEGQSTDELQSPLKRSTRLKYNCVSVSNKLVAFGSNTGGIYIFSRTDQKLLQIAFAEKETNSVSLVKISPHEKYVAFVSSSNIYVLDLKLESRSKAETLRSSSDLAGCLVTSLLWDHSSAKLYIGDDLGKVSMMPVYSNKAKNLFSLPLEIIMKLDSAVVQLDKAEDKVLVSTMTRCYLCDTNKQQYSQIGKKLRDGSFGACFLRQGTSAPMIYSARPGSRIWEVDFEGNVLNTHQFKQLLALPPYHIIKLDQKYNYEPDNKTNNAQSVTFPKLTILRKNFLLTWTTSSLYVLDPINVKVMLWTNQFTGVQDICCLDEEIYIFFESMKLQCISFRSVTSVIPRFVQSNDIESAAHLCVHHRNVFLQKHVRKKFGIVELRKIYDKLLEEKMSNLADQIHEVIVNVENKIADDSELEESGSSRSRSDSAISRTSTGSLLSTGPNSLVNGTGGAVTEINDSKNKVQGNTTIAQKNSDINQNRKTPEGSNNETNSFEETNHKHSNQEQKNLESKVSGETDQKSQRCKENRNSFVDKDEASLDYRNDFEDDVEGKDSGIEKVDSEESKDGCVKQVNNESGETFENTTDEKHSPSKGKAKVFDDKNDNTDETKGIDAQTRFVQSKISENLLVGYTETEKSDTNSDNVSDTVNTTKQPIPSVSVSESHVAMVTMDDVGDGLENDDDIGYLPVVTQGGPRRLSLTSLSSVDSADIHIDQPFPNDFDEVSDTIAIPVKRKSGKKKLRRRHSAIETGDSISEERMTRSRSLGTRDNQDREISPQGSVHSLKEEDSISLYSNDSVGMEETIGAGKDIPDGINTNKNPEVLSVGSPSSVSGEFTQSMEFTASSDYLQTEEYSPRESTLSRSWEKGRSSSVPKTALQQLRNKMQTKVTSGTKNLIRNIKEKNLLTKAKEFAENLSQGSEAYLQSGDVMYNDNPDILMTNPEFGANFKDSPEQMTAQSENTDDIDGTEKAIIDCEELEQITIKTKETLQDLEILTNPEAVYTVLLDWVTVLNKTFQEFHLMKYKDLESESVEETGSNKVVHNNTVVSEENTEADQNGHSEEVSKTNQQRTDSDSHSDLEKKKNECSKPERVTRNSDTLIKILSDRDFCYLTDPLSISADLHQDVSELAQACFDVGCHGDILKFIEFRFCDLKTRDKTDVKHDTVNNVNGDVMETVDVVIKEVDNSDESLKESLRNKHNSSEDRKGEREEVEKEKATIENESIEGCEANHIEFNHSDTKLDDEELKADFDVVNEQTKVSITSVEETGEMKDKSMAFFVRCYFPYLNVGRIREETVTRKSCFSLWSALVTCMEGKSRYDGEKYGIDDKSILRHLLNNEAGASQGAMLLGHISNLFRTKLDSVADICVRCHSSVHAHDVMYMCKYHQVTMETVFKQYMDLMTLNDTTSIRHQVWTDVGNHQETCMVYIEMLLSEDDNSSAVMDENGCPRCMGHKVKRKHEILIDQLTSNIEATMDQKVVLEILRKHGYWVGVLKLLKKIGPRSDHLDLVLQLGDIDLLNRHNDLGYEPDSVCDWQRVLAVYQNICETGNQNTQEVSCDWSKLIIWNNLAILLVRHVGSEVAISLLEEHNFSEGVLSQEFYQLCLLSGMVQKQQRSVLHSMLEKVDSYLWSYRPTVFTPQVQYLAVAEKKAHTAESPTSDLLQSMASRIKERDLTETSVEDPECHWGIENKINLLCPCCSVPLKETVSHDEPGVLLFKCGHGYHKLCLPRKECMLCDDSTKMKTLEKAFYI